MPKPSNPDHAAYMFSDDLKFLQKAVVKNPDNPNQILFSYHRVCLHGNIFED